MKDKAKIVGTWLFGEVLVPLAGPVVFAYVICLLRWTTHGKAKSPLDILWDILNNNISPWVLTVYALTLIGSTLNDLRARMSELWSLAVTLGVIGFVVGVYAGIIAVEQQEDPKWRPYVATWRVSSIMLLVAVALSGWGHYLSKKVQPEGTAGSHVSP